MGVTWTKAYRDNAKASGKALFGFSVSGRHLAKPDGFGSIELIGPMDISRAKALTDFICALETGDSPAEAFAKVDWEKGGRML